MSRAVLSLGSNLGDRFGYLRGAVEGLDNAVVAASPVYETAPWGGVAQGDFLNAVLIVEDPAADAWEWLRRAHELEGAAGRVRDVHWGPRTLDVDIVTVDGPEGPVTSDHPDLLLPHPGTPDRATVLRPWLDVEPHAVLPGRGPVAEVLAALGPDAEAGMRLYVPTPPTPQALSASIPRHLPTPPTPQAPSASIPRHLQAPPTAVPRQK